ncbi:hypothetical protein F3Y22_tig00111398pilonHSYRG00094 [Hibiscus syriacus]|uniref:Uncharacterized protein n=1 Tax=Hibiscus syriacus TaxID=106335 RepID=A0A6A2Y5M9_HIBSY|nr:hypothetical protein F3Y22_tig00111398pilonHSYRG00094 [Hibiscus syriacus]
MALKKYVQLMLQSTKGRRQGMDDVDGPSRLQLLNNPYYRDTLAEYGAFFAIANRIDHLHRNAWIGFQSWRATARKASLSEVAQASLLDAIEKRKYGDVLYFWVWMDMNPRNSMQRDFSSFCDAINAGNCKSCEVVFSETLKRMYGLQHDLNSLPPMPEDGGTWSCHAELGFANKVLRVRYVFKVRAVELNDFSA